MATSLELIGCSASQPRAKQLLALFGASTGAGAALVAAAERPARIAAVVSRGGRPGRGRPRAGDAPTLLIVGALDPQVLELNRAALGRLGSGASLEGVPGASHLFKGPWSRWPSWPRAGSSAGSPAGG